MSIAQSKKSLDAILVHWPDSLEAFFFHKVRRVRKALLILGIERLLYPLISLLFIKRLEKELKALKVPLLWYVHELARHEANGYVESRVDAKIRKLLFDYSSAIVATEKSTAEEVYKYFGNESKLTLLSHLGDYSETHGAPLKKQQARNFLGFDGNDIVFLLFGTFRSNRGINELLEIFRNTPARQKLLIVGQGYPPVEVPNIKVISGLVENEIVQNAFSAADFVLNPAKKYLNSGVLRTAMSYQKPVICYKYGSARDMTKGAAIFIDEHMDLSKSISYAAEMSRVEYNLLVDAAEVRNRERPWKGAALEIAKYITDMSLKKPHKQISNPHQD